MPDSTAPTAAQSLTRGYLICLTSTVLWSSTAVFIRHLTEAYAMPALVLAFWRDGLVFVTLASVFLVFKPALLRGAGPHARFLATYGVVLSLFNATWTVSVALNGAAISTVLAYSSAAFTVLLGWRLFGEPVTRVKVVAVILSITGTVLVSGAYDLSMWAANPLGVIVGLITGLCFAFYSLMGKAAALRGLNPWTTLLYTFGSAAVFLFIENTLLSLLPVDFASRNLFWLGSAAAGWAVLVVLAAGPTIGGYGLYTVSLLYLPTSVANLIATLEPAMTAVLAYLFLNERLTFLQLVGSVSIIVGVVVLRLGDRIPWMPRWQKRTAKAHLPPAD